VTKPEVVLTDPILPSHAWMVGIVAEPDGRLSAPPATSTADDEEPATPDDDSLQEPEAADR
jgi:hypothetical protein